MINYTKYYGDNAVYSAIEKLVENDNIVLPMYTGGCFSYNMKKFYSLYNSIISNMMEYLMKLKYTQPYTIYLQRFKNTSDPEVLYEVLHEQVNKGIIYQKAAEEAQAWYDAQKQIK